MRTSTRRGLAVTTSGILLVLAIAAPVLAHAELVSSDPADKAVLAASPASITLTFSEDLDPSKSSFKLVGTAGAIATGKVGGVTTQMVVTGLALAAGDYEIQWTSMSVDQHLLRGTLTFTVSAAAQATASPAAASDSPAPSAAASAAGSTPGASPVPSPSAAPDARGAASPGDVVLPIVAALALVGGAALWLVRRNRRA